MAEGDENRTWTAYAVLFSGVWLISVALSFSLASHAMLISDIVSGLLLIYFGWCMRPGTVWAKWAAVAVGIWLELAPLLFWAPTSINYLNDTLVGAIVMACAILVPTEEEDLGNPRQEIPRGWSYNPSSWPQRLPIFVFGCIGWFFARYMAAYQLGYIHHMWDPVFGDDGTLRVITSSVSRAFPVSDAGLGTFAYTLEAILALKGGTGRWHTMPWIVVVFGILVVPLGLVSIILIILQPVIVGHWCFWCLLAGLCMLVMLALTVDEVVAVLQYLCQRKKEQSVTPQEFWRIFWKGDDAEGAFNDARSPSLAHSPTQFLPAAVYGVTVPWNLLVSVLLGIWLICDPAALHIQGKAAADSCYVSGALVVTLSIISMAEVVRIVRYATCILGLWVACSAPFLPDTSEFARAVNVAVGIAILLLNLRRGPIRERYGDWKGCT